MGSCWKSEEGIFTTDGRIRTRFDVTDKYETGNDIHITKLKAWKLHIYENDILKQLLNTQK